MTVNQSEETKRLVQESVQVPRIVRWIEDPFASAFLATGVTTTAIAFVLTGMWLVSNAVT